MKRRVGLGLAVVCAFVLSVASLSVRSQDKSDSKGKTDAFREQFIKDFRRTGLNTTPGDAMMLRILVQARGAKRGIEVGSATGYGAINMGVGFERTGGHLTTIDIDPGMVKACRENIRKMGLAKTVTVVEGDALKVLPKIEGKVDFLFIDALKRDYFKYFKAVEARLTVGAVIVADNAIQSAGQMRDFLDFMEKSPDYEMVIIRASMEKRDGMAVCYKVR